ncbi:MAG: NADH-quinone oxidoreductase subunit L, partial [Rubrivivax sp.]|nr:NADH-quinone oxidoreductase subunit L [Rubrivivax sp.]
FANMKAFLVNRVGDFGFILGIGLLLAYGGSLNYGEAFAQGFALSQKTLPGSDWNLLTVACICLFIGAMGKSAQVPLHVWLPDSMEGPTPISALIHAATMVTAGIFMVARMSPLFELSDTALSFVLVIGAITALFMGFLGIIQNDIKRVVAYSTLSQLGYMTVALGASAYSVAVFHLMTHAFFKALLFLGAGSVIIGMHHDQDIRNMGGLRKYMPITWITSLLGSLALIGTPFFSGFFSKDSIILAVHASTLPAAGFAYFAVVAGVFITAFYSFRMYFLVFHGEERFRHKPHPGEHDHADDHGHVHVHVPHESPLVVWGPLVALAIPSVLIGGFTMAPMLVGDFFKDAIFVDAARHPAMAAVAEHAGHAVAMALHGFVTLPFWLAAGGVFTAWLFYLKAPQIPAALDARLGPLRTLLENKYYFDAFNEKVLSVGARLLGTGLWKGGDQAFIDGTLVNGSARSIGALAGVVRRLQTGQLYWYALVMVVGIFGFLTWRLWPMLTR